MVVDKTKKIPFQDLKPNNYNPRKTFRSASLKELAENIKTMGLIEPLVVRPLEDSKFEIVCGMRRYYALKSLKHETVLCVIKELTDTEALDISFSENMQRDNLNPIEQAKMYLKRIEMMEGFDIKVSPLTLKAKLPSQESPFVENLSKLYSKSAMTIAKRLQLLYLPEDLQIAVETKIEKKRKLPLGYAIQIARFHTIDDEKLAESYMLDMYKQYDEDRDNISESDINILVTNQIEQYNNAKTKQDKLVENKLKNIEKKIKGTIEAKDKEIIKLAKQMYDIYSNKFFTDTNFSELSIYYEDENDEIIEKTDDTIIAECDEDDKILIENERNDIIEKGENILIFLENKEAEYSKDETYKNLSLSIEEIGSKLTDISLLLRKVKEYNIDICPFCLAGIETEAINEKEQIYKEEKEKLENERSDMTGVNKFLSDTKNTMTKIFTALESKDKLKERFIKEKQKLEVGKNE